jgi:CheY-like chemotaxis protein
LEKNGFKVAGFTNPAEAIEYFNQQQQKKPDAFCAVLSDIRMPGLSGFQVARHVKQTNPDVKVILLSAFEIRTGEFSKVMPSTQIDDWITKPSSIEQIRNTLLKHVGNTKRLKD